MSDTASWITAIGATVTALYVFLTWRSYKNIEWFTGSMETYENVRIRLQALQEAGIKPEFIWWDPTINGPPPQDGRKHGAEVTDSKIYLYVPRRERSVQFNLLWSMSEYAKLVCSYFLKLRVPPNWRS